MSEFVWPYRTRDDVGPFGDSPKEMREVERLLDAVEKTHVFTGRYGFGITRNTLPGGIIVGKGALVDLDDYV